MFGALIERPVCLQQTDRNSRPLKLHVWKFHHDENATEGKEESASCCRKAAKKPGTNGKCSVLQELSETLQEPWLMLPRRGRQMSVNTSTGALRDISVTLLKGHD